MKFPSRFLRIVAIGAICGAAAARADLAVVLGERALAPKAAVPAPRLRIAPAPAATPSIALSPIPDSDVNEVRRANARGGFKNARRVVIGVTRTVSRIEAPRMSEVSWAPAEGGRVARLSLSSPDAGSLRLSIDLLGVPEDVEMVFFGSGQPSRLEGPVRVGDIADRSRPWWSPLTEGETQTVEIFVPSRHDPSTVPLRVTGASHIFTTPSSRFSKRIQDIGRAGGCNVDVPCSSLNSAAAFQGIADSVAQMVFTDGPFTAICTGSLLNDSNPSTQVPWFYSANHCFENDSPPYKSAAQMQAVANTLTTLWSFEANACGSNTPISSWAQLNGGATFIFGNPQSDALFLRLNNTPPAGAFFSGWDPNPIAAGTPVVDVHHPEGDLKKVSQGTSLGFSRPGVADGSSQFISVRWSVGTTEPGSSGSGLWTFNGSQYLLRGGLWGGEALCSNMGATDNFSRFDLVYPSIAAQLGATSGGGVDYTDLWWNPSESGWGLNLTQHPSGIIFGVWYTYDADGRRTWFVLPALTRGSANAYSGALYATAGPGYNGAFYPASVRRTQVGTATLTFTDASNGTFAFTVNGVAGVKSMTRMSY